MLDENRGKICYDSADSDKIKHIPLENVRDKKSDQGVQDDIQ